MNKRKKVFIDAVFIIYLIVLLKITVFRAGFLSGGFFGGTLNLTLFTDYIPIFKNSIARFIYLFVGNIIWFVPFGFYTVYFRRKKPWKAVIFTFFLSLFIEVMQYVFGTGISELDDIILNTVGGFIGGNLGRAYKSLKKALKNLT